ncbi:hypothetical protein BDV98DRAFT_601304 [Pterulicium gracile]|uniref:BHLH domain-containing protein n=1 Tax=Pterulicium gracile TaxID=1884261 RepID=A0A5C3QYW7_9AGAR|nr:hypothetical protein BDV98DRAFT_601304 [Pterula gracilis]
MHSAHEPTSRVELAPLQTLESQRRGSITDPALHAATNNPIISKLPRLHHPSATPSSSRIVSRPTSPYRFGDASREVYNRPNPPHESRGSPIGSPSTDSSSMSKGRPRPSIDRGAMVVDPTHSSPSLPSKPDSQGAKGKKRKASGAGTQESDSQLVGPGVHSGGNSDTELPAPKRRGSTVDTSRIANLSLYDRRYSVDSRAAGPPPVWNSGRRDSVHGYGSPTTVPGYSSPFPCDQRQAAPPGIATFSWPAHPPSEHPSSTSHLSHPETSLHAQQHSLDSNSPPAPMPPMSFPPPDRRMSVPEMISPTPTDPARLLRSRSRPPSRAVVDHPGASSSGSPAMQDHSSFAPAPPGAQDDLEGKSREPGASPYSRSPELRVSHKLAERKRRKEMKELFDELRDHLPADRGMKASKWEILSKAIEFVSQLKQHNRDVVQENDMLRHEVAALRGGASIPPLPASQFPYPPGQPIPGHFATLPPILGVPSQPLPQQSTSNQAHSHSPPVSRPGSSHRSMTPSANQEVSLAHQNGGGTTMDMAS